MSVDIVAIVVKGLCYLALMQAAGAALFAALFGSQLLTCESPVRRLTLMTAGTAVLLVAIQFAFESARMTGEFSGLMNPVTQQRAMHSGAGLATSLRLIGLALILIGLQRKPAGRAVASALGAAAIATSFTQVGHTSVHSSRWVLVPLLDLHLVVAAFWFGSIGPLIVAARRESPATARQLVDAFSSLAGWLVPMIAVAGVLMGWILTSGQLSVGNPYDLILGAKILLFAALMAMAAINRWRLGPALSNGTRRSLQAFCRSLALEYVLIAGVIVLTAVMTSLYGPEA